MVNSDQILALMIKAAKSSGQIVRDNFRKDTTSQDKTSHLDIVTKTDTTSQENIHDLLINEMIAIGFSESDIGFVEEESANDAIKTHNFIIDPIDGTTNFSSGIPFCCISIAYAKNKDINIGVVYEPFSDTLYWGEKQKGSFIENQLFGKRSLQLQEKPTKTWLAATHFNGLDVFHEQFATYEKIYPLIRGIRNIGSLTLDLCLMSDNIYDAVFCNGCFFWDLAAASVILHEAGGQIFSDQGQLLEFDWVNTKKKYHLIACHPNSIKKIIEIKND